MFSRTDLSCLHYFGILLATVSAAIHFQLGYIIGLTPLGVSFIFAGTGFLAGSAAVIYDYRPETVYLLGIPFTAGQIVLWWVLNSITFSGLVAGGLSVELIDKISQVLLIFVLAVLYREFTA